MQTQQWTLAKKKDGSRMKQSAGPWWMTAVAPHDSASDGATNGAPMEYLTVTSDRHWCVFSVSCLFYSTCLPTHIK